MRTVGLLTFALLALWHPAAALASSSLSPIPTDWRSTLSRDHPLVGVVFDVKAGGAIDSVALAEKLGHTEVVLLGEIHDNPDHHVLQSWAIAQIRRSRADVSGGLPQPAVVFEQFRRNQQPKLDAIAEAKTDSKSPHELSLDEIKARLDWKTLGWPDVYDPLLREVFLGGKPEVAAVYAGDVPKPEMMKVAKVGDAALPADEKTRLRLNVPLGEKADAASRDEIEEAHCGALPKSALGGMAYAQRYRDASLADAVVQATAKYGSAVLIAGTGHVRTDRGVPWYVRGRAPKVGMISVMFVEVEDGKTDPMSYVPRDADERPAVDYLVFTPRAERGDPCEKMHKK